MLLRHWFILVVIGTAFGSSFAFNEILLNYWSPLTISAARITVAAIGCWLWIGVSGRREVRPTASIGRLVVFGMFQYAIPFALMALAQESITSGVAGIANAMTPVAVVLLSLALPGSERTNPSKLAGVVVGSGGVVILMSSGIGADAGHPLAIGIAILAPFCYATALNLGRAFSGSDIVLVMAWSMTLAAVAILPVALVLDGMPVAPSAGASLALLTVGLITTFAFVALYRLLPIVGAVNVSIVTIVAPFSALVIGSLLLGEAFMAEHALGAGAVLIALLLVDGRALPALGRALPQLRTATVS